MADNLVVLFDACVLYSAPLRDFWMWLATTTSLFEGRWSEEIHREWMSNVLANRPDLSAERLERTRMLMDANVENCLVVGYEGLIDGLVLPDPNDRHVLAAAVHARANVILTFNLRDFPKGVLSAYGITAQHPDEFLSVLLEADSEAVCGAAEEHRRSLRNPPKTRDEYLETLRAQGLIKTVRKMGDLCS
ncbi:MAG: PIN domain-containing protein [Blastocatellia bacterium]